MGNTIELLEHNQKIYDQVIEYIKQGIKRIGIVQDTGLGKTYLSMKLMFEFFKGLRILYVAPTNALLDFIEMGYDLSRIPYINTSTYSALKDNNEKYDVIILDEFHRAGAPTWETYVWKKIDKGSIIIGLSATPIRYLDNRKDMTYLFDEIIYGMTLQESFEKGLVNKADEYISTYFLNYLSTDIKKKISSISDTPKGKLILNEMNVKQIIRDNCPDYKDRKWIIFFSNIDELESLDSEICDWLDIDRSQIVKVHKRLSSRNNKRSLDLFSNDDDIKVIKACGMLNEGVHVDSANSIIMLRKTISPIIYKQQIGRVMKIGNKPSVIIDLVGNNISVTNTVMKDDTSFRSLKSKKSKIIDEYREYIKAISINVFDYTTDINNILDSLDSRKHMPLSDKEKKIINNNIHLTATEIIEILKENGYERSMSCISYHKCRNGHGTGITPLSDEEKKIINNNIHLTAREIVEILKDNGYERSYGGIMNYRRRNGCESKINHFSDEEKKIIDDNIHLTGPEIVEILKENGYERSKGSINFYKRKNGHELKINHLSDEEKKIIDDNIHLTATEIIKILKQHGYDISISYVSAYKYRNSHGSGRGRLSTEEKKIINDNIHLSVSKIVEILKENGYERSESYIYSYRYNNGYVSKTACISDEEKKIIDDNIHLSVSKIVEILKENGYERSNGSIYYYKHINGHGSGRGYLSAEEKKIIDDNIHLTGPEIVEILKENGYERSYGPVNAYKRKNGHGSGRTNLSYEEKKIINDNIHLSAREIIEILKENGYERSRCTINEYKRKNGHGSGRFLSDEEKKIIDDNIHLSGQKIAEILKENGYERSKGSINLYKRKNGHGSGRTNLSDEEKKIINVNIHLSAPKIAEILKENGYERSIECVSAYKYRNGHIYTRFLSAEEKKIIDDNIHLSGQKIAEILKEHGYERSRCTINSYKRKKLNN